MITLIFTLIGNGLETSIYIDHHHHYFASYVSIVRPPTSVSLRQFIPYPVYLQLQSLACLFSCRCASSSPSSYFCCCSCICLSSFIFLTSLFLFVPESTEIACRFASLFHFLTTNHITLLFCFLNLKSKVSGYVMLYKTKRSAVMIGLGFMSTCILMEFLQCKS